MIDEEPQRWFFETRGVPVSVGQVKHLVEATTQDSAVGSRAAYAR